VHPSALLAPLVGARRVRDVPVLALALLLNPYGWKAIVAPIELTAMVNGGQFVNAEWLPSSPLHHPILYVAILIAIALVTLSARFSRSGQAGVETQQRALHWWRVALLAMFAVLAVRHVRNQPLFFAAFPMLVPLPPLRLRPVLVYAASALAVAAVVFTADHRLGVPPERFPIAAVAQLRASGLRGNIYNADQFGGYLIWTFYPERRVLTDGRNELYRSFIPEWQEARVDQRKWMALLRKYDIALAVEEYRPPLRVTDARTGRVTEMEASLAYWPRDQWMLIAKDDAAMVFARRSGIE
jgi:hypothetical protein